MLVGWCLTLNYGAVASDRQVDEVGNVVNQSVELLHAGHPDQAIPILREALARFPASPAVYEIHFELGNALSDKQEFQNSVEEYKLCLEQKPDFAPALINIAYSYVNLGQFDLAKPNFDKFLAENPNWPNAASVKAQMLIAEAAQRSGMKRFYDAKTFLEQACALTPTNATAHFKLARACDELGDTKRAIYEYEEALRLKPDYDAAAFNIAGCYQTLGQTDQAVYWFQKYLLLNPTATDRATVLNMIAKMKELRSEIHADPHSPDYVQSITENGRLMRWAAHRLPLKIFIAGDKSQVYRDAYRDIFIDAIEEWSKASQDRLKFVYVKSAKKADIVCDWTSNPFDVRRTGSDVEQGICFTQAVSGGAADGTINKATVRVLMIDPANQKALSDDSMKVTCLHEFGHAIGLRGHSNNNHDVMFYSVSPTVWPILSKRDKATIFRLYAEYPKMAQE